MIKLHYNSLKVTERKESRVEGKMHIKGVRPTDADVTEQPFSTVWQLSAM